MLHSAPDSLDLTFNAQLYHCPYHERLSCLAPWGWHGTCGVQYRKSGEPFITHPVEVTRILAELKMDYESLIAGLLHDTVEDTENVKFEEIEVYVRPASASRFCNTVYVFLRSVHFGRHCLLPLRMTFWTPAGACLNDRTEVRLTHCCARSSILARRCGRLWRARRASPR